MAKNPKYWTKHICLQCGEPFDVYKRASAKGKGKFCSVSCGTTYRNIHDNPTKCPEVRKKISKNHANFSGKNNPMYGVRGKDAPGYIDGRNDFVGEPYRKKALANLEAVCPFCYEDDVNKLDVHHADHNRKNNDLLNLVFVCKDCHRMLHPIKRDKFGRFV